MNNKLAYFVIGAILVVVAGVSVLLFLNNNQKQKPSSSTGEVHKQGTPTKNLSELQKQGWVGNITIIEGSALPEILTIEKDWAVSFTNQSTKDIEINITGDRDLMVVKIPAGKNMMSPIFMNSGSYKFTDTKNPKISGDIIVEGLSDDVNKDKVNTVQPTNVLPTSKPIKDAEVIVMSTGTNPSVVRIIKEQRVKFINKTTQDLAIQIEGKEKTIARTNLDNTYDSIIFRESGTYKYADMKNPSIKGEIIVD